MIGKLFSKAGQASSRSRKSSEPVAIPDVSRVLKPRPPVPSRVLDEAAVAALPPEAAPAPENLAEQFEAWMRRDLEALRQTWADAQKPEASAEDYRRLYTAAHNITGAAPSYGFPSVSRLSQSLCRLLARTHPGENSPLINLHVEACRAAIAAGAHGEASHSIADAVCDALERRVAAKVAMQEQAAG